MSNDTSNQDVDQRYHDRTRVMLKIRYRAVKDFLADYTENISAGGVFITTDEEFSPGTTLDFEVSFPGLLDPISLKGIVKWIRPATPFGEPAGIGVQFLPEQSPGHNHLSGLVSRLNSQSETGVKPDQPSTFRVLLVEDNEVVRDMFRYAIQKITSRKKLPGTKLEVEEASNGREAWEILKARTFHLVVLDLYMPVMEGDKLIQFVRSDPSLRTIPIIVVSSGGREDRKRAIELGADLFLSKPVKLKEMVESIEILIASGHGPSWG